MFFEIFIFMLLIACVAFKCSSFSFRCGVVQQIQDRQCVKTDSALHVTSTAGSKARNKRKRTRRGKQQTTSFDDQPKEKKISANITQALVATDSTPTTLNRLRNRNVTSEESAQVATSKSIIPSLEPIANFKKLDDKARNRTLYSTEKATEPFTFLLDESGGWVRTPFCKLLFLYRAVVDPLSITVAPQYPWKESTTNARLRMTPEVYFTSEDEMKFQRPVEVHLQTHYTVTKKKEPINVEIERTEHCEPPNWLKLKEVKFSKGMIKFSLNQFCGIRAVCSSCQRSLMSSRVKYFVSVKSDSLVEVVKNFYLRIFTDTPEQVEEMDKEMENDGYRRIHPSEKYTVRHGCNVMAKLTSEGFQSTPGYDIIQLNDDIICEAILFQLALNNNAPITTPSFPVKSHLAEVSAFKTTRMVYTSEAPNTIPRSVHFTFNGGTGILTNFNTGDVSQQNFLPSATATPEAFNLSQQYTMPQTPPSVQVHSTTPQRAFEVTPVEETVPKSLYSPQKPAENLDAHFGQPYRSNVPHQLYREEPSLRTDVLAESLQTSLNLLRPLCSSRLSTSSLAYVGNGQCSRSPKHSESHPTYTQTLCRRDFDQSRRSAFHPLARNSSHPSLADLDSILSSTSKLARSNDDLSLSALAEEDNSLCPQNSYGFSDEVFEALVINESKTKVKSHSSTEEITREKRPLTPKERPSAISSGFESGFSTRDPSCTDFDMASFSPIKFEGSDSIDNPETEVPAMRSRSVSCPKEVNALR